MPLESGDSIQPRNICTTPTTTAQKLRGARKFAARPGNACGAQRMGTGCKPCVPGVVPI
jgi:hypothetical protein